MKRRLKSHSFILKTFFCLILFIVLINPHAAPFGRTGFYEIKDADILLNSKVPYTAAVLLPNERVVTSYAELKSALAYDNGITTVYFGNDIVMQPTGVRIHPSKTHIIVDGFNPLDPEQTQPYTLTDHSSATFIDTIYIDTAGPATLLVRDLKITGKNYYGSFSVIDIPGLSGLTVTYERVDYNGPQIAHHRAGLVRFIDCAVRIHGGNGGSLKQEVAEAKHLIYEGKKNTIYTESTLESVYWLPGGGSFKIADDSSLALTSSDTCIAYGIFTSRAAAYNIDIEIGRRATFNLTMTGVLAAAAYVTVRSFSVREGGAFYLTTTKAPTEATLTLSGNLSIDPDASFVINGFGSNTFAVIQQTGGDITVRKNAVFHIIASGAYPKLINLVGKALICNDPASVLLYNDKRDIEARTQPGKIEVSAQQINLWGFVSGGGFDAPPDKSWKKADNTNFWITGALAIGASGNFSSLSSNYMPGDSPGIPPDPDTFSMVKARVLAFGRLELLVSAPTEHSTTITGVTAPGAAVRVSFRQQGTDYVLPDVTANSEGVFHVNTGVPLDALAVITVRSSYRYLNAAATVTVDRRGILEFSVPEKMTFSTAALSVTERIAKRLEPDWHIEVSDTRGADSEWSLFARLAQPLTPSDNTKPVLTDALVFINSSVTPLTADGLLIYHHVSTSDNEVINIHWSDDSGVLIYIPLHSAYAGITYTAVIEWTLINAP